MTSGMLRLKDYPERETPRVSGIVRDMDGTRGDSRQVKVASRKQECLASNKHLWSTYCAPDIGLSTGDTKRG